MSMGKLNRGALEELYAYWYFRVNKSLPSNEKSRTKVETVRLIWMLKRSFRRGDIK